MLGGRSALKADDGRSSRPLLYESRMKLSPVLVWFLQSRVAPKTKYHIKNGFNAGIV